MADENKNPLDEQLKQDVTEEKKFSTKSTKKPTAKSSKSKSSKPKKAKKTISPSLAEIQKAEALVDSRLHDLELETNEKVTTENVFDILDRDSDKKNIVVPRKVLKMLKRAEKHHRHGDEHKDDKNTPSKVIEVKNVSKYYINGNIVTRVLKDVSIDVNKGELMLIFGVSGGGKSTLLNLISGLDRPSKGQVVVCNKNLPYLTTVRLTEFRRDHVSFIFQNYNLLENLSAYDNVETGAYLQKDPSKKVDIVELFKKFGMEEEIYKFPAQMSGGQQQRVSIMRALAKNAEIVFADEPTGALDEETTKVVLDMLYRINKETGATVVMVSHNPVMAAMADRVIHVVNGHIEKVQVNEHPTPPDQIKLFN